MNRRTSRRLLRGLWALGAVLVFGLGITWIRADRKFEAPLPAIEASRQPEVIARGRYLVRGIAHCGECHGQAGSSDVPRLDRPLAGGHALELPVGTFYAPNITPDPQTGIGRYTDAQLARVIRYGVKPDGTLALPFMNYANLSDADLQAIVSYLRSEKPISNAVPEHRVNLLGRAAKAWFIEPKGPDKAPPTRVDQARPVQYGEYLANDVGNCVLCHTKMDMRTGALIGVPFAGGSPHPAENDPSQLFLPPNLTPDSRWGWLNGWSVRNFVDRFHGGRVYPDSPMPWEAYQRLDSADLEALFAYLNSLPPSSGGPDPQVREVKLTRRE